MKIKTFSLGQLSTNCYFLIKDDKCLIIDPGDDAQFLKLKLSDEQVKAKAIVATHGHFDHIMAVFDLKLTLRIPFIATKADKKIIKNMKSSAKHFLGVNTDPAADIDQYLNKGKMNLYGFKFEVIETPGHTPGSVCLYFEDEGVVFVGDLIFAGGGVGRFDFSYSSKEDLIKSIERILKLPDKTIVYSGHGGVTTIGEYRENYVRMNQVLQ